MDSVERQILFDGAPPVFRNIIIFILIIVINTICNILFLENHELHAMKQILRCLLDCTFKLSMDMYEYMYEMRERE